MNETPEALQFFTIDTNTVGEVFENHIIGDVIGSLKVYDPDIDEDIMFTIQTNADEKKFALAEVYCDPLHDGVRIFNFPINFYCSNKLV